MKKKLNDIAHNFSTLEEAVTSVLNRFYLLLDFYIIGKNPVFKYFLLPITHSLIPLRNFYLSNLFLKLHASYYF